MSFSLPYSIKFDVAGIRLASKEYQDAFVERTELEASHWAEYLKDYDLSMQYHVGKTNVVVFALSRKTIRITTWMVLTEWKLLEEIVDFHTKILIVANNISMNSLMI